jgi:hypothetical protein
VSGPKVYGSPIAYATSEDWAEVYRQDRRVKWRLILALLLVVGLLLVALLLVACSAPPDVGPPDVAAVAHADAVAAFCAPEIDDADLELARRWWGIEFRCPDGFPVEVAYIEPGVGGRMYSDHIEVSPLAWHYDVVDVVFAHEIGHVLGYEHSPDRCDVMFRNGSKADLDCIRGKR